MRAHKKEMHIKINKEKIKMKQKDQCKLIRKKMQFSMKTY